MGIIHGDMMLYFQRMELECRKCYSDCLFQQHKRCSPFFPGITSAVYKGFPWSLTVIRILYIIFKSWIPGKHDTKLASS